MKKIFFLGIFVFLGFLLFFALSSNVCIGCSPTGLIIGSVSATNFSLALEEEVVLIDIRTPLEFDQGHIEGAKNIDFYSANFKSKIDALDKNKKYLIYCRSGSRSNQALKLMEELGFVSVRELNGGINSWALNGLQIVN